MRDIALPAMGLWRGFSSWNLKRSGSCRMSLSDRTSGWATFITLPTFRNCGRNYLSQATCKDSLQVHQGGWGIAGFAGGICTMASAGHGPGQRRLPGENRGYRLPGFRAGRKIDGGGTPQKSTQQGENTRLVRGPWNRAIGPEIVGSDYRGREKIRAEKAVGAGIDGADWEDSGVERGEKADETEGECAAFWCGAILSMKPIVRLPRTLLATQRGEAFIDTDRGDAALLGAMAKMKPKEVLPRTLLAIRRGESTFDTETACAAFWGCGANNRMKPKIPLPRTLFSDSFFERIANGNSQRNPGGCANRLGEIPRRHSR